jgi:hypothetical protein
VDPYRTSLEGQRLRALAQRREALAEHERLTRFLLEHLDPRLVARMNELRAALEDEPEDEGIAAENMDFLIAFEAQARELSQCVATAIEVAHELRGWLATPADEAPNVEMGDGFFPDDLEPAVLRAALPPDATEVQVQTHGTGLVCRFLLARHPIRLATGVSQYGRRFRLCTSVAPGGPPLHVVPAGIFHRHATGDEEFDSSYALRATDAAITTWLTLPVRKALLGIARVDPAYVEIERGSARISYAFGIEDKAPLRHAAKALVLLREAEVKIPALVRKR